MRFEMCPILAEEDIGKVVVGVLIFVVWGIASLASMVKKANEEARRKAMSRPKAVVAPGDQRMAVGTFAAGSVSRPPPLPPAVLQKGQSRVQKRQPIKQAPKVVAQPVRAPAPAPKARPTDSTRPVVEKVVSSAASNIARSNLAGAKAPAIRKWLVPATLRKQFILTELLRPPIALREER